MPRLAKWFDRFRPSVVGLIVWTLLGGCTTHSERTASPEAGSQTASAASALPSRQEIPDRKETPDPGIRSPDEGFSRLTLADFTPFPTKDSSWREERGLIVTSGHPKGYIHSRESYSNFTWRGEFRYVPAPGLSADQKVLSNTGFMIHIQEPHKVWPRSLEVQGRWDELASIKANGGIPALSIQDDQALRDQARRPVGEWNSLEITVHDGAISVRLNGIIVCQSEPGELTSGMIGLQAELFAVEFRNLDIRRD